MGMLRVALALAVLLTHLPPATFHFMGGGLAVQSFFIVSGFYMSLVLSGKYPDRGLFYTNRLLRLAPTYFVMMAFCAVALFGFGITATATPEIFERVFSNPVSAAVLVFENLFVVGQEMLFWFKVDPEGSLYLDPAGGLPTEEVPISWQALLVPQSWSLSMELMFYAIAPFMARMGLKTLVGIAVASIALRFAGHLLPVDYGLWQGRFFPTALFLFVFGMLAHRASPLVVTAPRWLGVVMALATIGLVVLQPMLGLPDEIGRWVVYIAIACALPFVFHAFKNNGLDRWVGELSYPIYLSHLLIVAIVLTFAPPFAAWVAIVATFAASALLLLMVDGPVDRWRQRRASVQVRGPSQSASAAPPG